MQVPVSSLIHADMNLARTQIINKDPNFVNTVQRIRQSGSINFLVNSETLLLTATAVSNLEAVKLLLECGANPEFGCYYTNGLSTMFYTPLQMAVTFTALETVYVLLDHGAKGNFRYQNLNARDIAYQNYCEEPSNPRKEVLCNYFYNSKRVKNLKPLEEASANSFINLNWSKVNYIWHELLVRETQGKTSHEEGVYSKGFLAPNIPVVFFKRFEWRADWESIIYQTALLLEQEDSVVPTKHSHLWDKDTQSNQKVVMQLYLEESRFKEFTKDWSQIIQMPQYIKAVLFELYWCFGDGHTLNLMLDSLTGHIVHFDLEHMLPESNRYTPSGKCVFLSALLSLDQAFTRLDNNDIIYLELEIEKLSQRHHAAQKFFKQQDEKAGKKAAEKNKFYRSLSDDSCNAWDERLQSLKEGIKKVKNGELPTMIDFVCFCMPTYKLSIYTDLAYLIWKEKIDQSPTESPNGLDFSNFSDEKIRNIFLFDQFPKLILDNYYKIGISFESYQEVANVLIELPFKQFIECIFQKSPIMVRDQILYEKETSHLLDE